MLCYHVDDIMIAGNENDEEYQKALSDVRSKYEWGSWEEKEFEMCGCHVAQGHDGSITLDQTSYARAIEPIPLTAHRRKHEHEKLTQAEHKEVLAKR